MSIVAALVLSTQAAVLQPPPQQKGPRAEAVAAVTILRHGTLRAADLQAPAIERGDARVRRAGDGSYWLEFS